MCEHLDSNTIKEYLDKVDVTKIIYMKKGKPFHDSEYEFSFLLAKEPMILWCSSCESEYTIVSDSSLAKPESPLQKIYKKVEFADGVHYITDDNDLIHYLSYRDLIATKIGKEISELGATTMNVLMSEENLCVIHVNTHCFVIPKDMKNILTLATSKQFLDFLLKK